MSESSGVVSGLEVNKPSLQSTSPSGRAGSKGKPVRWKLGDGHAGAGIPVSARPQSTQVSCRLPIASSSAI